MKILHTSDWHVGKRIGRHDRIPEQQEAIAEVAEIADRIGADLVLHSGDLFDRPIPPVDALRAGLDGLLALTDGGNRPVVVVAGNHDSPQLFEVLAPYLEGFGVRLVGRIKPPDSGGVLDVETRSGTARVACFPFLRAAQAVDFMERADRWYGVYADRVRRICEVYAEDVRARRTGDDVGLLVAHFMVTGVSVRTGAPRGERELHMGEAYAATTQSIPTALDYVAMGHIHAPQPVPGSQVPAEYAGSLLQLDFGEAGESKRVVVIEAGGGAPARVSSVPITAGRRLERVTGRWEDVADRDDLEDAYLDLVVETEGPDPGLADLARDRFPLLVKVQADYERPDRPDAVATDRPLDAMYAEYHRAEHGTEPGGDLLEAFRRLEDEVTGAAD
jgi:exonuclease SbcD